VNIDPDYIASLGHYPVMYREVMQHLDESKSAGSVMIDCTMGSGGHSGLILEHFSAHSLISFERDREIAQLARTRLARFGERHRIIETNYVNLDQAGDAAGKVSGIVYDLGISTWHYESARGFAFKNTSPLDMRLDDTCEFSAAEVVNTFAEGDLADIFFEYGEERFSRRIARLIAASRQSAPIATTDDLAKIVMRALPPAKKKHEGIHPATRVFQALRIYVNNELDTIAPSLQKAWKLLAPGGRLIVISFHSLEDRIVKSTMRELAAGCDCGMRECICGKVPRVRLITRKPLLPQSDEVDANKPSRSAKMRVCERI